MLLGGRFNLIFIVNRVLTTPAREISATYLPFVFDKALNYRGPKTTNVYVAAWVGMVDFVSLGVQG